VLKALRNLKNHFMNAGLTNVNIDHRPDLSPDDFQLFGYLYEKMKLLSSGIVEDRQQTASDPANGSPKSNWSLFFGIANKIAVIHRE
jgi:hypothetical protein